MPETQTSETEDTKKAEVKAKKSKKQTKSPTKSTPKAKKSKKQTKSPKGSATNGAILMTTKSTPKQSKQTGGGEGQEEAKVQGARSKEGKTKSSTKAKKSKKKAKTSKEPTAKQPKQAGEESQQTGGEFEKVQEAADQEILSHFLVEAEGQEAESQAEGHKQEAEGLEATSTSEPENLQNNEGKETWLTDPDFLLDGEGRGTILLDPEEIQPGWRARQDYGDVEALAQSIQSEGQLQPIVVYWDYQGEEFIILAGSRRTKACALLGRQVEAIVAKPANDLQILDMQLAENLHRKNFDLLEIAEGLKIRKEFYEEAHPEAAVGGSGKGRAKGDIGAKRFTLATALQLGISETKVKEMLQLAELSEEEKQKISEQEDSKARNKAAKEALQQQRKQKKQEKLASKAQKKHQERSKKAKDDSKREATDPEREDLAGDVEHLGLIYNTSYAEVLPQMELFSLDLILTDPPYGLQRAGISHSDRGSINGEDPEWDELDVSWVQDVEPCLDEGGTLMTFCPFEGIGLYKQAFKEAGLIYRGTLVWHKTNPAPTHRNNYVSACEAIVWATKGEGIFVPFGNGGELEAHNFIEGPVCGGDERHDHPAQKPLWLIERLLKRHSIEGQNVFDPFMGTGTTVVAAERNGRYSIGCELNPDYFQIAKLRFDAE